MEIKMCTCPNGHYYNADIYSTCPECGAANAAPGGAQDIGKTMPANASYAPQGGGYVSSTEPAGYGGYGAGPVGVTEPIGGGSYGGAQAIGKTVPANASYGGGMGATIPVDNKQVPSGGFTPFSNPTISANDLTGGTGIPTEPVVGWMVCVEGPLRGVDFRLHDGYNFIGREEGDIHIQGDNAISRKNHAMVAFYAKRNTFHVGPTDGRNIIELNGEPVFNPVEMKSYDVLTVGNTKLMLVALCGPQFNWVDGNANG